MANWLAKSTHQLGVIDGDESNTIRNIKSYFFE